MMRWSSMTEAVGRLIWPRGFQCLRCGCLSGGEAICSGCRAELNALICREMVESCGSALWHRGAARDLVLRLKFGCEADCASVLAGFMMETAALMELPPETVLTWVPMPDDRFRERGIDHAQLLCRAVAALLKLPVQPLLRRTGYRLHTQKGLNAHSRRKNLLGAFAAAGKISAPVLLIDDVYTTGATAFACTQALLEGGAPSVQVLTAARTPRK